MYFKLYFKLYYTINIEVMSQVKNSSPPNLDNTNDDLQEVDIDDLEADTLQPEQVDEDDIGDAGESDDVDDEQLEADDDVDDVDVDDVDDDVDDVVDDDDDDDDDEPEGIGLEYGDMIKIIATNNDSLNEKILIDYIDENKIKILNEANELTVLDMVDKTFTDETIEEIQLLDRTPVKGYAAQNSLTTNTWITIEFGGDVPFILTGEITDVIEDMIEFQELNTKKMLYIDFKYSGIPEALNITSIRIRDKPMVVVESEAQAEAEERPDEFVEADPNVDGTKQPVKVASKQIDEGIIFADAIEFGDDEEQVMFTIDVDETEKRFDIEDQGNSLLDDMLSRIPTGERNFKAKNNVHKNVMRFKELREIFSIEEKNVLMLKKNTSERPLSELIQSKQAKFPSWILPIGNITNAPSEISKKIAAFMKDEQTDDTNIKIDHKVLKEIYEEYYNSVNETSNKYYQHIISVYDYIRRYNPSDEKLIEYPTRYPTEYIMDNVDYVNISNVDPNSRLDTIFRSLGEFDYYKSSLLNKDELEKVVIVPPESINVVGFGFLQFPFVYANGINNKTETILEKSIINKDYPSLSNALVKEANIKLLDKDSDSDIYTMNTYSDYFRKLHYYKLETDDLADSDVPLSNSSEENLKFLLEKSIPKTSDLIKMNEKYTNLKLTNNSFKNSLLNFGIEPHTITSKENNMIEKIVNAEIINYKNKERIDWWFQSNIRHR